ncbi:MAG TPA: glucosaminidase domain-containing protein [Acidimicrobiia bacterium]|nr:glucosaminidase domain-containing protein [Acidimicrobiia bacterium]
MTQPFRCRAAVRAALLLGIAVLIAAASIPAGAQTPPPSPPTPPDVLTTVALELSRTTATLDSVARAEADAQARLTAAQAVLADVTARTTVTKAQIDQLKAQLVGRAAQVYEQHNNNGAVLRVQHVIDIAAGEQYTNAAAIDGSRQLQQLNLVEAQLEQEQAQAAATRQAIADDELRLEASRSNLEAVRARDQALLDRVGAITIMGDSRLTAAQVAAWFHSTGQVAHLPDGTTIDNLAGMYIEEGATEHVRGDVAFAQAIIETGSFGQTRGNNYAGIGNCDSCNGQGIMFATPQDGVRAQIQLLRSYADPSSRAATLAHLPEPALFGGTPAAAAASYDSFAYKGAAPVWNVMGNGKWATDPDYATKVLDIYARMVGFAATHG